MKRIIAIVLMICLAVSLAACGGSSSAPAAPNAPAASNAPAAPAAGAMTIRFGHVLADTHPYHLAAMEFKSHLEANAPSPVTVEIYPSGALGGEREMTEAMQLGSMEIALAPGSILSFEPNFGVLGLPYLFTSREHAYAVLDGEIGQQLASGLPGKGLRLLSYWENGFRQITNSKKPITVPSDLNGVKIRVPENKIYVDSFSTWGANVTAMAFTELFTALQQGTVDGQENALALICANKLYEVQQYVSISNHVYEAAHLLISEKFMSSQSPEMQEAIVAAANHARDFERKYLVDMEDSYLKELNDAGIAVNDVDVEAFKTASMPVWDKYRAEFGDVIDQIAALG